MATPWRYPSGVTIPVSLAAVFSPYQGDLPPPPPPLGEFGEHTGSRYEEGPEPHDPMAFDENERARELRAENEARYRRWFQAVSGHEAPQPRCRGRCRPRTTPSDLEAFRRDFSGWFWDELADDSYEEREGFFRRLDTYARLNSRPPKYYAGSGFKMARWVRELAIHNP